MRLTAALLCAALPVPLAAQGYDCAGAPGWSLDLQPDSARFYYPAETRMEVMLETPVQGADWPRAFTLIGERDTAIVLLERESCTRDGASFELRAHVFTQRGQSPILLTGCCTSRP